MKSRASRIKTQFESGYQVLVATKFCDGPLKLFSDGNSGGH